MSTYHYEPADTAVKIERAEPLCDCGHAHDRHDETGHCTARGDCWRCAC